MVHLYQVAVDFRQDRRGATYGDEPEGEEVQEQGNEIEAVHHSPSFQAATSAKEARAPMTQRSGQRKTPTPTKAMTANSQGRQCRGNTSANFITVASSSPAATM